MKPSIETNAGTIVPGTLIRIVRMADEATPSRAFPDGIDHQARAYNGKTGTVNHIDDRGQIHGTWGGLALQADRDEIEILKQPDKR